MLICHYLGVGLKYCRLFRVFDMLLKLDRVGSGNAQQLKQQTQDILQIGLMPTRSFKTTANPRKRLLDHCCFVGQQERTDCCPADHHQFEWQRMQDYFKLAASKNIPAKNHREC